MLKCWEADVDSRICFKEIIVELTREVYATKNSADSDYVTVVPCHTTELTKEPSDGYATENSTNKDYVTEMSSELTKEPIEAYATEGSADMDYVTVMPCHEVNS